MQKIYEEDEDNWERKESTGGGLSKKQLFFNTISNTYQENKEIFEIERSGGALQRGLTMLDKKELQAVKEEELRKWEILREHRPPEEDSFGLQRSSCSICGINCLGYKPVQTLFNETGTLPSFCECGCPSNVHKLVKQGIEFPSELVNTMRNHKMAPNDINFNFIVVIIAFAEGPHKHLNIKKSITLLEEIGYEVLVKQLRYLSGTEMANIRETRNKFTSNFEYVLEQQAKYYQEHPMDDHVRENSDVSSNTFFGKTAKMMMTFSYGEFQRTFRKEKTNKIGIKMNKPTIVKDITNYTDYTRREVEFHHQCLILGLSSPQYQNLHIKFPEDEDKLKGYLGRKALNVIYSSPTKVKSFQDAIEYFPNLFLLFKSCLLAFTFIENLSLMFEAERNLEILQDEQIDEDERAEFASDKNDPSRNAASEIFSMKQRLEREKFKKDPVHLAESKIKEILNFSGIPVLGKERKELEEAALPPHVMKLIGRHLPMHFFLDKSMKPTLTAFAIGKVGFSPMLNSLSMDCPYIGLHTIEKYQSICEEFFPVLNNSQRVIIIFRPLVLKTTLNNMLIKLFNINNFLLLKKQTRMLSKEEVLILAHMENIPDKVLDEYIDIMMESEVDILVLYKFGAISEGDIICNGCKEGRRRTGQLTTALAANFIDKEDENYSGSQQFELFPPKSSQQEKGYNQLDSVKNRLTGIGSLMDLSPFTSISEFIDLEDFILKSTVDLKKISSNQSQISGVKSSRMDDDRLSKIQATSREFYFNKLIKVRQNMNSFCRQFNIATYNSPTENASEQLICMFFPNLSKISELVVLVDPRFYRKIENIEEFLTKRMKYHIISSKEVLLESQWISKIMDSILGDHPYINQIIEILLDQKSKLLFLTKPGGKQEMMKLFNSMNLPKHYMLKKQQLSFALEPQDCPKFLIPFSTPFGGQTALEWLDPEIASFNPSDLSKDRSRFKVRILEYILQTTIGESIMIQEREGVLTNDPETLGKLFPKVGPMINDILTYTISNKIYIVSSKNLGIYEINIFDPHNDPNSEGMEISEMREKLTTQMEMKAYYYEEVNRAYLNISPAFYQYRMYPMSATLPINRIFECYEYMGEPLIEEVISSFIRYRSGEQNENSIGERGSLVSYLWGQKIGQMCQKLESIRVSNIKGAGRIIYEKGEGMIGEFGVVDNAQEEALRHRVQTTMGGRGHTIYEGQLYKGQTYGGEQWKGQTYKRGEYEDTYRSERERKEEWKERRPGEEEMHLRAEVIGEGEDLREICECLMEEMELSHPTETNTILNRLEQILNSAAYAYTRQNSNLRTQPDIFNESNLRIYAKVQRMENIEEGYLHKAGLYKKEDTFEIISEELSESKSTIIEKKNPKKLFHQETESEFKLIPNFERILNQQIQNKILHIMKERRRPIAPQIINKGEVNRSKAVDFFREKKGINYEHQGSILEKRTTDDIKKGNFEFSRKLTMGAKEEKGIGIKEERSRIRPNEAEETDAVAYIEKRDIAIVGAEVGNRPKYHLIAGIIWTMCHILKKVRRREDLMSDKNKREYSICIENIMRGIDNIYNSFKENVPDKYTKCFIAPIREEGRKRTAGFQTEVIGQSINQGRISLVRMEVFIYGLRYLGNLLRSKRGWGGRLREYYDYEANCKHNIAQLQSRINQLSSLQYGKVLPPTHASRLELAKLQEELTQEEAKGIKYVGLQTTSLKNIENTSTQIILCLQELCQTDIFIDIKYMAGEDQLKIGRQQYFKPSLNEYWEDNMKHPRYMRTQRDYQFGTEYVAPFMKEDLSAIEKKWINQPGYIRTDLRDHEHTFIDGVLVPKEKGGTDIAMKKAIQTVLEQINNQ